jgi:hypothetical protein
MRLSPFLTTFVPLVLLVHWSLVPFPWWNLKIDLPLGATLCFVLHFFLNCCRFGFCFDHRIARWTGGVAPLLGFMRKGDQPGIVDSFYQ